MKHTPYPFPMFAAAMLLLPHTARAMTDARDGDQYAPHVAVDDRVGCISEDVLRGEVAALLAPDRDYRQVWVVVFAGARPGASKLSVVMTVKKGGQRLERRDMEVEPSECANVTRVVARIAAAAAEGAGQPIVEDQAPSPPPSVRPARGRGPMQAACLSNPSHGLKPLEVYRRCLLWMREESQTSVMTVPGTAPVYGGTGGFVTTTNVIPITTKQTHIYQGVDGRPLRNAEFYRLAGREDLADAELALELREREENRSNLMWALSAGAGISLAFAAVCVAGILGGAVVTAVGGFSTYNLFSRKIPSQQFGLIMSMLVISLGALFVGPGVVAIFVGGLAASPALLVVGLFTYAMVILGKLAATTEAMPLHEKRLLARQYNQALMEELNLGEDDVASLPGG